LEKILATKRAKNTQKMPSLPLFGSTGSSLGRIDFCRGKSTPNQEIKDVLETR